VYRARDELLGRPVALKIFSEPTQEAALREARTASLVRHGNVVHVYDAGWIEGRCFIAMELVDGDTLRRARFAAGVCQEACVRWLLDVARALVAVHRAGVLHLDVKPGNVVVQRDGRAAKLIDFGLSQVVDTTARPRSAALGTPRYLAPEQIFDGIADARSDQWAWGVVAYEILTGHHPMDVCAAPDLFHFHDRCVVPPATSLAAVPDALSRIVSRALSRDPGARFATMDQVAEAVAGVFDRLHAAPRAVPSAGLRDEREEPTTRSPSNPRTLVRSDRVHLAPGTGGWPTLVRRVRAQGS
jgi:serine/threonine-protein kinase